MLEDDDGVRAVTEGLLAELGCRVTSEPDAVRALQRLTAGEVFDLMLSDIVMPGGMNGVELARAAAARAPDLPIVLTTMTAIGGLLPLAFQGSGLYSPLAWVIIGGLVSSTLIARLVTPVLYKLLAPALEESEELVAPRPVGLVPATA